MFTTDNLKLVLPKNKSITQELVDEINNRINTEELQYNFKCYSSILKDSSYSLDEYINAVTFVTYKMLNKTQKEAWSLTFPDRYDKLIKQENGDDKIRAYASMYEKTKLVIQILAQTYVPAYITNTHYHQESLNILMEIARNPRNNPMSRVNACKGILEFTKQPEVQKVQMEVGIKQTDEVKELMKVNADLAKTQLAQLESGNISIKEVAESKIIEGEIDE